MPLISNDGLSFLKKLYDTREKLLPMLADLPRLFHKVDTISGDGVTVKDDHIVIAQLRAAKPRPASRTTSTDTSSGNFEGQKHQMVSDNQAGWRLSFFCPGDSSLLP
jgi:hypothetical protein